MTSPEHSGPLPELIARSNRLGADRRNTNYGGGNTSAKGVGVDPVSGDEVDLMWVKGSGGDLATLTEEGVSVLQLDRVRALRQRYDSIEQEDSLHQMLDHCVFGAPGPAPSIDTSMHALLPAAHVDHLHPDSVISVAASADGVALTTEIFGDEIGWVPWQRPGFDLAVKIEELRSANPRLRGVVMGGHGLTTWADTSEACERISLEAIRRAAAYIAEHGRPEPLGANRVGYEPLAPAERRRRALALAPVIRSLASTDRSVVGRWFDDENVLDFIGREATPRLAPLGTSCPDHFIRTKVRPLLLDLPATTTDAEQADRLRELHGQYRDEYRAYFDRHAGPNTPQMRGADPAIFLVPGVGMFSFGIDLPTAQVAGEFYINAINVIRGAEAISRYTPVPESEKFGVEYWLLEDLKLKRRPSPKPLTGKVAVVFGADRAAGAAIARDYTDAGAVVVTPATVEASAADVAVEQAVLEYGGVDVIVGAAPSRGIEVMAAQGMGGDIVVLGTPSHVADSAEDFSHLGIRTSGIAIAGDDEGLADDVARAALVLVDGSLQQTHGLTIPIG